MRDFAPMTIPPLTPRPDVVAFLNERRSRPGKTLVSPAPGRDALAPILAAGLRVPDHGKLEPWRLIVLENQACKRLAADVRACGPAADPEKTDKEVRLWSHAPLIVVVVACPIDSPKVPALEQLLSAGAVCLSLVNAALASGWGANWLSNYPAYSRAFMDTLGLSAAESIAGFIHIGTEGTTPPERPRPEVATTVEWVGS